MGATTDKKVFSFNEAWKFVATAVMICGVFYQNVNNQEEIRSELRELKAFINGDNKAGEIRVSRLEEDNRETKNQITMMSTSLAILQKELDYSYIKKK